MDDTTPQRWEELGFIFPLKTLIKATSNVCKTKIGNRIKSVNVKYIMLKFYQPKVLFKIGIRDSQKCKNCPLDNTMIHYMTASHGT